MKLSGEIVNELFLKKKSQFISEKESLSSNLKKIENEEISHPDEIQKLFDFSNNLVEKFKNSDDLKKRELLSILSANLSLLNQKLNISFQKPINYIGELKEEIENELEAEDDIRTSESTNKKRTHEVLDQVSPIWLRE